MNQTVKTPFSEEQVENLNKYQLEGKFHPFTCCGSSIEECFRTKASRMRSEGEEVPYTNENEGILIATQEGWVCPCGKYKQDWAHGFMSK